MTDISVERTAQALIIADEIMAIMEEYRRQEAAGYVDTPGGLEHMGDVWTLLAGWDESLRTTLAHAAIAIGFTCALLFTGACVGVCLGVMS